MYAVGKKLVKEIKCNSADKLLIKTVLKRVPCVSKPKSATPFKVLDSFKRFFH